MSDFKSQNSTEFIAMGRLAEGYTVIPNGIMNDIERIGADGFTILAKIFQFINSPTHKISVQGLSTQTKISKNRVSKALNVLIEVGYIVRTPKRVGNITNGYNYLVYDTPVGISPSCGNPHFEDTQIKDTKNGDAKKENNKKENNKKENKVVVVGAEKSKFNKLIDLCKQYQIQKKITPTMRDLLEEYSSKIDMEVFEQIFIDASEDAVKSKYRYIADTLSKLVDKNIKSINDYNADKKAFKESKAQKISGQKSNSKKVAPVKTRFHNINQTFDKYAPDELEQLLLNVQKEKFNTPEVNAPVEKPIKELGEKKKTQFHNFEETEETFDKYTPSELDAIIEKSQAEKFGKLSQNKSTDNNEANPEVNPEVVIFNPRFKID